MIRWDGSNNRKFTCDFFVVFATIFHNFQFSLIGNQPVRGDYQADVGYIYALAANNSTATKIIGGVDLRHLRMRNKSDREAYNAIVEALRKAGFNGQLATYEFVSGSYYWCLTPS